jgi:hypothetical protein
VVVDLSSSGFDTYVMLVGPGEFREENDDWDDTDVGHSVIEADLADAGTYQVLVTSFEAGETGAYALRIDRGEVTASVGQRDVQTLELRRPASGSLESGDGELDSGEFRDTWVFNGQAGQSFSGEMSSDDFDPYLILLSPDGDVIDENDDFDGRTDHESTPPYLRQGGTASSRLRMLWASPAGMA